MLSLITVNWGDPTRVRALWESLQQHPPPGVWQWIIIDNGSGAAVQSQLRQLASESPHVHSLALQHNVGFGRANNEAAQFSTGQTMALLNPDTQVTESTWTPLLEQLQHNPQAGIIAPQLTDARGHALPNCRHWPTPASIVLGRLTGKKETYNATTPHVVDWAQGSFWMLKKSVWQQLQGFDDRYFLFFEDTDLCRRVHQLGLQVVRVPAAQALHSSERLSGQGLALFKKVFWIHMASAVRYFVRWGFGFPVQSADKNASH